MVVSHGNTLRALVKEIDGVSDEDVFHLDLPTATPLIYEFDSTLNHIRPHGFWGDQPSAVRHGRYLLDESKVRAAQEAMRQQVSQNIAYTTYSETGEVVEAAFTAKEAGREVAEIEGEGYTVRQTPPAYFFQESQRLEQEAQSELREFWTNKYKVPGLKKRVRCALVLLRHGQSAYNSNKRFTGWADPDLTNRGRDEARLAGQLLKATGIDRIDVLYTSLLKRAVKTAWLALDEMDLQWTPILNTWRLNERNYGALQGHVKAEVAKVHGLKQVQKWRRGYADRPPPWDRLQREKTVDRRYASAAAASGRPALSPGQRGEFPPLSESLADCHGRLVPFLEEELWPAMEKAMEHARGVAQAGYEYQVPTMVVVASENVLRAMVMHMEGLEQDEVPLIDVPYATPLVYQLDSALAPIDTPWAEFPLNAGWYLGDPAKVRAVQAEIQADLPPAAEDEEVCLVRPDVEEPPSWKCG
uniref:Phosphoglycerate mutase n=1 Tax=Haptolina ericina TaxID=156174 RepID=A0A7S3BHJ4_9EUKA